jgi:hypothetical protein
MPPSNPDPLFWPLLFVALIVAVFALALVKVVAMLARRDPGHHPQQAQGGGSNIHDASMHHTTSIGEIKVNVKQSGTDG